MKNNEALIMLSDAIDLQKETLQILREALAVLKAAVEELKASRVPTYVPPIHITPYTSPVIAPYTWTNTQPNWICDPSPNMTPTITCKGTNTISNIYTSQANGVGVFYSNTEDVCGKNL